MVILEKRIVFSGYHHRRWQNAIVHTYNTPEEIVWCVRSCEKMRQKTEALGCSVGAPERQRTWPGSVRNHPQTVPRFAIWEGKPSTDKQILYYSFDSKIN